MMNAQIEAAARGLAQAEADLQDAEKRHEAALAEVAVLQTRMEAIADRRAQIRSDLADGTLNDREAGGLLALANEDATDLRRLLTEAQGRVAAAVPVSEQNALNLAITSIERAGREFAFEALHSRVMELEEVFLQALGALYQLGQELGRGRSLSGIFRPSDDLRKILVHNQPPLRIRHE